MRRTLLRREEAADDRWYIEIVDPDGTLLWEGVGPTEAAATTDAVTLAALHCDRADVLKSAESVRRSLVRMGAQVWTH